MKTTKELRNQIDRLVAELEGFLATVEATETTILQARDEVGKALSTMATDKKLAAVHLRMARQFLEQRKGRTQC